MPVAATPPSDTVLELLIRLDDLEPPITRVVQVPARFTFHQLHRVIQAVMPWQSYHLHEFETPDGVRIGELDGEYEEANPDLADREARLADQLVVPGDEVNYQYDFGDGWDHEVRLVAVRAAEPGVPLPRLLAGTRAAPPEDSGGAHGYQGILENLRSPAPDPELLTWLPRGFNPEVFDLEAARRRLARDFKTRAKGFQVQAPSVPPAPPPEHNPWCERLGVPVPQVEALAQQQGVKLIGLMVGALLERGAPMTLSEVAQRLSAAGVVPATGDLESSLRKAWKRQPPVIEGGDGRLRLDLDASRLKYLLWELKGKRQAPAAAPPAPLGDEVPLTESELEAAFRGRYSTAVSSLRQAAAVLDVAGAPMPWEAVEARLAALTPHRHRLSPADGPSWRKGLVVQKDGQLLLDRAHPSLGPTRRAIRALAAPAQAEALRAAQLQVSQAASAQRREESAARMKEEAANARRALLVALPDAARPEALGLMDLNSGAARLWTGAPESEVAQALEGYDLIAAPSARTLLENLGLDADRWRLADLKPPQRTLQRGGRVLPLTPELILRSTLGLPKPLPDNEVVQAALARGDQRAIERLLHETLRVYRALYAYGVLQHSVLVRHGRNLETLPVEWALPGDPHLWSLTAEAMERSQPVELVTDRLPTGPDPFAKAHRGVLIARDRWTITLLEGDVPVELPRARILAARLA